MRLDILTPQYTENASEHISQAVDGQESGFHVALRIPGVHQGDSGSIFIVGAPFGKMTKLVKCSSPLKGQIQMRRLLEW